MGGVSRPEGQRLFDIYGSCSACAWVLGLFWLAFGNLNNGVGNSGLSCLNGNNALSNANWNILARKSGIIYCAARRLRKTAAGGICRSTLRGKLTTKTQGLVGNERP